MRRQILTTAALAALALAACDRTHGQRDLAPVPATAMAALPPAPPSMAEFAPAPRAEALPRPHRVRYAARGAPYGAGYEEPYWDYVDDAYWVTDVYDEAPPDYAFDYGDLAPVAWLDGVYVVLVSEPVDDGYRYYYYRPRERWPYYVQDPQYGYGFDGPRLTVVYDRSGRPLPQDRTAQRLAYADSYFARGEALRSAAQDAPRRQVAADVWRRHTETLSAQRTRWTETLQGEAPWRARHDARREAQAQRWTPQQRWREREAQTVAAIAPPKAARETARAWPLAPRPPAPQGPLLQHREDRSLAAAPDEARRAQALAARRAETLARGAPPQPAGPGVVAGPSARRLEEMRRAQIERGAERRGAERAAIAGPPATRAENASPRAVERRAERATQALTTPHGPAVAPGRAVADIRERVEHGPPPRAVEHARAAPVAAARRALEAPKPPPNVQRAAAPPHPRPSAGPAHVAAAPKGPPPQARAAAEHAREAAARAPSPARQGGPPPQAARHDAGGPTQAKARANGHGEGRGKKGEKQ